MKSARYALTAALGIVWNIGIVMIVLAMIVAMSSKNWTDSSADATENTPRSIISASDGEKTRAVLEVGAGKPFSNYVLEDKEGRELLLVTYSRSGSVIVTLGSAFPIRPGYSATVDGIYNLEVAHGGFEYRLKIRPGGTSGFTVSDPPYGGRKGVGVTAEGEFIQDQPIID
ncbi:MAG: hypothetical protein P4L85_20440 [Paludisphaera borealis]|uniref:hypothetical protein n=1 Tax=Paludisphaera borealis TaxID=1387353 RepID=UPI002843F3B9|nr:hypothetical protein [Paludisphaera borealis]MDR3621733.1 hypothetical protein [Paludisphaera borealis]